MKINVSRGAALREVGEDKIRQGLRSDYSPDEHLQGPSDDKGIDPTKMGPEQLRCAAVSAGPMPDFDGERPYGMFTWRLLVCRPVSS